MDQEGLTNYHNRKRNNMFDIMKAEKTRTKHTDIKTLIIGDVVGLMLTA